MEAGDPEEDWEGAGGAGRGFYLEDGGFSDYLAWLLGRWWPPRRRAA